MAQMNLTPLDDVLDKHFGKVGPQILAWLEKWPCGKSCKAK